MSPDSGDDYDESDECVASWPAVWGGMYAVEPDRVNFSDYNAFANMVT